MIQRDIYEIIVVRHDTGEIITNLERVVATSSEAAMAKVDVAKICTEAGAKFDDVEYIILRLGSLRPVQEVSEGKVSKF